MSSRVSLAALVVALAGCSPEPLPELSVQSMKVAARGSGDGGYLSLEVLATVGGEPLACDDPSVHVSVEIAGADGHYADLPPQAWTTVCDEGRSGELALVVDNSGSEDGFLPWLQEGARTMLDGVLGAGGRSSLVRVSTNSAVRAPMTDDGGALQQEVDDLWIANGWTALWDGVRMGNESISVAAPQEPAYDDLGSFCAASRTLGVVVFTDGQDNNSADEQAATIDALAYPGDGIDTTFEDVQALRVNDVTTPIYPIGLGEDVSADQLQELADRTGGRYLHVDEAEQLPGVFGLVSDLFDATRHVCVEVPTAECGDLTVRVTTTWSEGGAQVQNQHLETLHLDCETPPAGRVATILLTSGDPGIDRSFAATLSRQTVEWVSPVLRPRVLVVLDDNHSGEDTEDAALIRALLADDDTLSVTYLEEPAGGLTDLDVVDADVVWFSNPGYPMDDARSFETLRAFQAAGGGVVLQGDDMTQASGNAFDPAPLTHTDYVSNGTSACGQPIDNGAGGQYRVTVSDVDHAITRGLVGDTFLYGNDIDHNVARGEGEVVLATAVVDGDEDCMEPIPVIIGFDPN